jgi:hypothetical protein
MLHPIQNHAIFSRAKSQTFGAIGFILLLATTLSSAANGQIFFSDGNNVEEYALSGNPINADLIPSLGEVQLAVSGNDLFVLSNSTGKISEYTTDGQLLSAAFTTNIASSIAVSGDKLFLSVANGRSPNPIMEYTTSGVLVNSSIGAAGPGVQGMTVSGNELYVESDPFPVLPPMAGLPQYIGDFSISGGIANPTFITTSETQIIDVATLGNDIFTLDFNQNSVLEYSTSGAFLTSSLITLVPSDVGGVRALAVGGNDLFVLTQGTLGEYAADGKPVNANLISGLDVGDSYSMVVEVPEPGAFGLLTLGFCPFLFRRRGCPRH